MIKATLKDGNLIIAIPFNSNPEVSKSGKSRMVATTNGFAKTELLVGGKVVSIGLNAITSL